MTITDPIDITILDSVIISPFQLPGLGVPGTSLSNYIELLKTKIDENYRTFNDIHEITRKAFHGSAHHIRSLGNGNGFYYLKDMHAYGELDKNNVKIDIYSIYFGIIIEQSGHAVQILVNITNPHNEAYVRVQIGYYTYSHWEPWTDQLLNIDKNNISNLLDYHLEGRGNARTK